MPANDPTDAEALRDYRPSAWPRPSVTVDLAVFTVRDTLLHLLLIRRKEPPFRDQYALPGGFVRVGEGANEQGEDLDDAAARELHEETGLPRTACALEQLRAFGRAGRDPRTRVISVAYLALVRPDLAGQVHAGTDAAEAGFFPVTSLPPLAFDHGEIVEVALEHLRRRISETPIARVLVPPTFTITELRAAHEAVQGQGFDNANFRRRFRRLEEDGIVEPAPGKRLTATRPAQVFRFVGGGK